MWRPDPSPGLSPGPDVALQDPENRGHSSNLAPRPSGRACENWKRKVYFQQAVIVPVTMQRESDNSRSDPELRWDSLISQLEKMWNVET